MRLRGMYTILAGAILTGPAPSPPGGLAWTGPVEPPRVGPDDRSKLLANVTHLSDNDIRFRTSRGISVYVDPMAGAPELEQRGLRIPDPDLILITHPHLDHYNVPVLLDYGRRNPLLVVAGPADVVRYARANRIEVTALRPGQEYTLAGVTFLTLPAYHADEGDHPKERDWLGYVLRLDGATYYVPGDTQPLPEMAAVKADVLLAPVFGCGSNIDQALQMVRLVAPRVVVPVHTGGNAEVITEFLGRLPSGVRCAWYADGRLVLGGATAAE
jgi:L-ascorbate metabolism protein UlaG (beta-lactamase superfamily)